MFPSRVRLKGLHLSSPLDGSPMAPNFLLRPMGSKNFLRLSLKKGAHGDLSRQRAGKSGCSPWRTWAENDMFRMLSLSLERKSRLVWQKRLLGYARLVGPTYAGANTPNFLHAALDKSPCAPFFEERRMRFLEPIDLNRKFGDMGHPSDFLRLWL